MISLCFCVIFVTGIPIESAKASALMSDWESVLIEVQEAIAEFERVKNSTNRKKCYQ